MVQYDRRRRILVSVRVTAHSDAVYVCVCKDGSGCNGRFGCALLTAEDSQLEEEDRLATH